MQIENFTDLCREYAAIPKLINSGAYADAVIVAYRFGCQDGCEVGRALQLRAMQNELQRLEFEAVEECKTGHA